MSVIIRPFRHDPGSLDWAGICALYEKVYGLEVAKRRERALRWVTLENPVDLPEARRYVADDDGRIVGSSGRMAVRFTVAGRPFLVRYAHDLLVDPDYRGQKLGERIVEEVVKQTDSPLGGLWMTDASYHIHQKGGLPAMTPAYGQVRLLNPAASLERRLPRALARIGGSLARAAFAIRSVDAWGRDPAGYTVEETESLAPAAGVIWPEASPLLGVAAVRDDAYVHWRFDGAPNTRYVKLVARKDGRPRGTLALRLPEPGGAGGTAAAVDFLARPDEPDAITALFREALARARAAGAPSLGALTTCAPFRRRLTRLGFIRAPRLQTFVLRYLPEHPEAIRHTANWYLTFTDSDGDVWTGAQPATRV